jgi:hypothetical protein
MFRPVYGTFSALEVSKLRQTQLLKESYELKFPIKRGLTSIVSFLRKNESEK